MDGQTGVQAARGGTAAQGGDQDFLLGSCLISPLGHPLSRVPDREWGVPGQALSNPPTGSTMGNPAGKWAGRRASWVRSQSSPQELAGAENCGNTLCKARPSRKKNWDPFCTRSVQGSEEAKASEARLDFRLAGQGVEPSWLPPREQKTGE